MIINLLEKVQTAAELERLKALEDEKKAVLKEIDQLQPLLKTNHTIETNQQFEILADSYEGLNEEYFKITSAATDKYYNYCGGEISKIYEDAQVVADAIDKKDFLQAIKLEAEAQAEVIATLESSLASINEIRNISEEQRNKLARTFKAKIRDNKKRTRRNYENCCQYIKDMLNTSYAAAFRVAAVKCNINFAAHEEGIPTLKQQQYNAVEEEAKAYYAVLDNIAEEKAKTFYNPPASYIANNYAIIEKDANQLYYNYPTGETTFYLLDALRNLDNLERLANTIQVAHGGKTTTKVAYGKDNAKLVIANNNINAIFEINKLEDAKKIMKPLYQIFVFLMIKINENCRLEGKMIKHELAINLQELVDCGLYENLQSARNAVSKVNKVLYVIGLQSKIFVKGKGYIHATDTEKLRTLFSALDIDNNMYLIALNKYINWNIILHYFSILPKYYFLLGTHAQVLLEYIFYRARQNTKYIKKVKDAEGNITGKELAFNINMRRVQEKLKLPNENDKDGKANPSRVKKTIKSAIDEINEAEQELDKVNLTLEIVEAEGKLKTYLDESHIEVFITGEYVDYFDDIKNKKADAIEDTQEKVRKALEAKNAIIDAVEPVAEQ